MIGARSVQKGSQPPLIGHRKFLRVLSVNELGTNMKDLHYVVLPLLFHGPFDFVFIQSQVGEVGLFCRLCIFFLFIFIFVLVGLFFFIFVGKSAKNLIVSFVLDCLGTCPGPLD